MNDPSESTARHPIQVAARRSGLSQDVLRAWEKRYAVVEPARSPGGQRLYSDADVERLRLLRLAVDAGRRISKVAGLSTEELAALVVEDQAEIATGVMPVAADPSVLLDCMDAIHEFDALRLEQLLQQQLLAGGVAALIEGLVAPLMVEVGRLWHEGRISPSHEHMATQVVVGLVGRVLMETQPLVSRGTLVVATTKDQRHEVGALMAAATATQEGWSVIYLGSDLPANEIAAACQQVGAHALGLSLAMRSPREDDLEQIAEVAGLLPADTSLLVGGAAAQDERERLVALGATVVPDFAAMRAALGQFAAGR